MLRTWHSLRSSSFDKCVKCGAEGLRFDLHCPLCGAGSLGGPDDGSFDRNLKKRIDIMLEEPRPIRAPNFREKTVEVYETDYHSTAIETVELLKHRGINAEIVEGTPLGEKQVIAYHVVVYESDLKSARALLAEVGKKRIK